MLLQPRILLAFANPVDDPDRRLDQLRLEMKNLAEILQDPDKFEVILKPEASKSVIINAFKTYGEDVKIFHFAGHAHARGIETIEEEVERKVTFAPGLAEYIGLQNGVRLAFLNGCSTEEQVAFFHNSDIPAVIATKQPVNDRLAREFAESFYDHLISGRSIQESFEQARAAMAMVYQEYAEKLANRGLRQLAPSASREFPYDLYLDPDKATVGSEGYKDWFKPAPMKGPIGKAPIPLGTEVHLLCDRLTQNNTFEDDLSNSLADSALTPQFFLIHGDREDLPNSLADRFYKFSVREIFQQQEIPLTEERFMRLEVKLPTKTDFESASAQKPWARLASNFKKKGYSVRDNAQGVLASLSNQLEVVLVQHTFMAAHWHDKMEAFLQSYLHDFWSIELKKEDPHLIVVIDITYTREEKGMFSFFKKGPNSTLEKALLRLSEQHPHCKLLERLPLVTLDDVEEWKNEYLEQEVRLVDQIFGASAELPMIDVQPQLKSFLQRHNDRYG